MISSLNSKILAGGLAHCDMSWNKSNTPLDQCFKLYFPQSGKIELLINHQSYYFIPNHFYFINGYQLQRQSCIEETDIYWLHFVPESLYLKFLLMNVQPVCFWKAEECTGLKDMYEKIPSYFETPQHQGSQDFSLYCLMQSMILGFISKLLQTVDTNALLNTQYIQHKPSIDMMNVEYKQNPPLSAIANRSFLSDKYFHRLFTKVFKMSPFNYMLSLRNC